jgi:hypothetical protein
MKKLSFIWAFTFFCATVGAAQQNWTKLPPPVSSPVSLPGGCRLPKTSIVEPLDFETLMIVKPATDIDPKINPCSGEAAKTASESSGDENRIRPFKIVPEENKKP